MLYIFYGKDSVGVRERALSYIETLVPMGGEVAKVTAAEYREGMILDLAESTSLFGGAQVVLLDTPSTDTDFEDAVLEHLEVLRDSANHFVVIEEGLLAAEKKAYTKYAAHIEEIESKAVEKFNTFALTDALITRDKKTLWLLLMEAWKNGQSNEAIVGLLFWQLKTLRLVERTSSPEEAGQKPFVYQKAKRALAKFKKGELDGLSRELLDLYHKGHQGRVDLSVALERWVLGV